MDELSVFARAKPPCEILEDATLVAHFKFDSGSVLIDSGPNSLSATIQGADFSVIGSFTGGNCIRRFVLFFLSNRRCDIARYLKSGRFQYLSGFVQQLYLVVLVHISSRSDSSSGWCIPFVGFSINDSVIGQVYSNFWNCHGLRL